MEIYLIRHTTPATEKGLIYGRMDVPLAISFDEEKEVIMKQLPPRLDAIYSSPSKRCCALADVLSKRYRINEDGVGGDGVDRNMANIGRINEGRVGGYGGDGNVPNRDRINENRADGNGVDGYHVEEDLYEMNFGNWEGKNWDTVDRAETEFWMADFVNLSPPGGESMLLMQQRVMRCWARITRECHDQDQIAVVTHGGVIRIILAHYGNIELKDSFSFKVELGSVFKLLVASP